MDKFLIRGRFGRKAETYQTDDSIEEEISRRLLEHLEPVRINPARVLDAGAGTGTAQRALAERFPMARVTAVDFARSMLERARRQAGAAAPRLDYLCTDIESLGLRAESFDLVYSNLALVWCAHPEAVLRQFQRVLRPGGLLALSCFGPDTLSELRASWRAADEHPHVQEFPDMHDLGDALHSIGFKDIVVDAERLRIEYRDLDRLVADLRDWGVGNVQQGRRKTLSGRARARRMRQEYESYRDSSGKLPATCEVAYVHAWSAERNDSAVPHLDLNPLRRRR